MAKIIEKLLDVIKLSDDYDDDEFEDYDEELEMERLRQEKAERKQRKNRSTVEDFSDNSLNEKPTKSKARSNNVVPLRAAGRNMEVCVIKPSSVEDAREISDTLLSGRAVVINLEGIHVEIAQRIIDFTSGACYSMNGNLQKITSCIFIVTPSSIELSGDFAEMLADGAFDMSSLSFNV